MPEYHAPEQTFVGRARMCRWKQECLTFYHRDSPPPQPSSPSRSALPALVSTFSQGVVNQPTATEAWLFSVAFQRGSIIKGPIMSLDDDDR